MARTRRQMAAAVQNGEAPSPLQSELPQTKRQTRPSKRTRVAKAQQTSEVEQAQTSKNDESTTFAPFKRGQSPLLKSDIGKSPISPLTETVNSPNFLPPILSSPKAQTILPRESSPNHVDGPRPFAGSSSEFATPSRSGIAEVSPVGLLSKPFTPPRSVHVTPSPIGSRRSIGLSATGLGLSLAPGPSPRTRPSPPTGPSPGPSTPPGQVGKATSSAPPTYVDKATSPIETPFKRTPTAPRRLEDTPPQRLADIITSNKPVQIEPGVPWHKRKFVLGQFWTNLTYEEARSTETATSERCSEFYRVPQEDMANFLKGYKLETQELMYLPTPDPAALQQVPVRAIPAQKVLEEAHINILKKRRRASQDTGRVEPSAKRQKASLLEIGNAQTHADGQARQEPEWKTFQRLRLDVAANKCPADIAALKLPSDKLCSRFTEYGIRDDLDYRTEVYMERLEAERRGHVFHIHDTDSDPSNHPQPWSPHFLEKPVILSDAFQLEKERLPTIAGIKERTRNRHAVDMCRARPNPIRNRYQPRRLKKTRRQQSELSQSEQISSVEETGSSGSDFEIAEGQPPISSVLESQAVAELIVQPVATIPPMTPRRTWALESLRSIPSSVSRLIPRSLFGRQEPADPPVTSTIDSLAQAPVPTLAQAPGEIPTPAQASIEIPTPAQASSEIPTPAQAPSEIPAQQLDEEARQSARTLELLQEDYAFQQLPQKRQDKLAQTFNVFSKSTSPPYWPKGLPLGRHRQPAKFLYERAMKAKAESEANEKQIADEVQRRLNAILQSTPGIEFDKDGNAIMPGGKKKRKRVSSPAEIPNPEGVSYGMDLDYFGFSSSEDEAESPNPRRKSGGGGAHKNTNSGRHSSSESPSESTQPSKKKRRTSGQRNVSNDQAAPSYGGTVFPQNSQTTVFFDEAPKTPEVLRSSPPDDRDGESEGTYGFSYSDGSSSPDEPEPPSPIDAVAPLSTPKGILQSPATSKGYGSLDNAGTTQKKKKRVRWQGSDPPPPPTPAHAILPEPEALAKARAKATQYTPKQPSGLRAASRLSSSSVGSVSDLGATPIFIPPKEPFRTNGVTPETSRQPPPMFNASSVPVNPIILGDMPAMDPEVLAAIAAIPDEDIPIIPFPTVPTVAYLTDEYPYRQEVSAEIGLAVSHAMTLTNMQLATDVYDRMVRQKLENTRA